MRWISRLLRWIASCRLTHHKDGQRCSARCSEDVIDLMGSAQIRSRHGVPRHSPTDFTEKLPKTPNGIMCSLCPSNAFSTSFKGQTGGWGNVDPETAYDDIKSAINDFLEAKKDGVLPDAIPIKFTPEEWEYLNNTQIEIFRGSGKTSMLNLLNSLKKTKKI